MLERIVLIADAKSGKCYLESKLNGEEYATLKITGEINLSDWKRDLQTLAMNQKSIDEANSLA